MNRATFLRKAGLGAVAAILSPSLLEGAAATSRVPKLAAMEVSSGSVKYIYHSYKIGFKVSKQLIEDDVYMKYLPPVKEDMWRR